MAVSSMGVILAEQPLKAAWLPQGEATKKPDSKL